MQINQTVLRRVLALVAVAMVSGCVKPPSSSFLHRGPESLIDVSSEVVTLNVATAKDVSDLGKWIAKDAPTRAELQCDAMAKNCRDALRLLEKKGVVIATVPSAANTATLVYERVVARDCDQHFRDRQLSSYNTPSASFGCATSANVVQHVSDKTVFVNPALSDVPSARGAVSAMQRMNAPRTGGNEQYTVKQSLSSAAAAR